MTPEVEAAAELRVVETLPEPFVVNAEGTATGWGPAVDTRLRLAGEATLGRVRAEVGGDVLSGQLLGDTWALAPIDERGRNANDALSLAGVVPRTLRAGVRLPVVDVEAGLGTSRWGLGLLANDGATDPWFGRSDFGDRTVRLRFATAPFTGQGPDGRFPLYVILAGDAVVADDTARWAEGDRAFQGIGALLYRSEAREGGLYGVFRDQTAADGARTKVGVVDGTGRVEIGPARLAAEGALVLGRTNVARSYTAPDGVRVRQGGLAVEGGAATDDGRAAGRLQLALASGDASADDDLATDFRFDRDYAVGMVLFDEVWSAVDLAAYAQASDPSVTAHPPDGVESLAAEGAFRSAVALAPATEVAPIEWLALRGGLVFAWSTGPIAQPFYTFRNGGVPTNAMGEPTTGRYLGTEVDWAVASREVAVEDWRLRPSFALEVGHAFPSRSLLGDAGRIDHVLVVGQVDL